MMACVKERCSSCWSRGCETWLHSMLKFFFEKLKLKEGFLSSFWLDSNTFSIGLTSWIHAYKDQHCLTDCTTYGTPNVWMCDVCMEDHGSLWGWIGKSEFKRMWRYLQFSRSRRTTRFLLLVRGRVQLGWIHHKSSYLIISHDVYYLTFQNVLQHKTLGLVQQGILAWHRLARLVLSDNLKIGEVSGIGIAAMGLHDTVSLRSSVLQRWRTWSPTSISSTQTLQKRKVLEYVFT